MRGTWIKNSVLLLGITFGGMALLAQQATAPAAQPAPETTTQSTTAPTGEDAVERGAKTTVEQPADDYARPGRHHPP